ncbi:hypothetical protein HPB50_028464 [Hyalomma asiaticum]|nr:hypothetical protein HPB50_028464 [Hyalomma asiaticum]
MDLKMLRLQTADVHPCLCIGRQALPARFSKVHSLQFWPTYSISSEISILDVKSSWEPFIKPICRLLYTATAGGCWASLLSSHPTKKVRPGAAYCHWRVLAMRRFLKFHQPALLTVCLR